LDKIAKAVKMAPATLRQKYATTAALVPLIAFEIDRQAFAQKFTGAPHDILFDILMARFDIMQKHRPAITGMAKAARHDRTLACALGRATIDGTYCVIEIVKITHPPRPALAAGIIAIYSWAFLAWQHDSSRDMARTMAALDRGLRLASKALAILKPRS
jgi:hypothetical protein